MKYGLKTTCNLIMLLKKYLKKLKREVFAVNNYINQLLSFISISELSKTIFPFVKN